MFRILYAEKDATLYESAITLNSGLDEILEISKQQGTSGNSLLKSRVAVKFNTVEISEVISKYNVDINQVKFILRLYTTHAKNLPSEFTLEARVIAQPWINGTGFSTSNPIISNGVTWALPYASWSLDSQSGSAWISSSQQIQVAGTSLYVSGSGAGGSWLWQSGSGLFNTSSFDSSYFYQPGLSLSDSFNSQPTDINMNVTDAIKLWLSGSGGIPIENNGFILKFSDADELNPNVTGTISYFSRDTHTIYVPKLIMYWDDSAYSSSLAPVETDSFVISTKTKPTYKDTEVVKIRIYARNKFPQKSPTNLFPILNTNRLPSTTYYAVRDAATDEYIIPYDNIYNKVSCDDVSNFIHIDMNGLMPERYYRIELKIIDGITEQFALDNIYFKVVR